MDHFYFGKGKRKLKPDGSSDFDDPESIDIADCARAVTELKTGNPVTIPVYDMNEKVEDRTGTQMIQLKPDDKFIVIPGIFSFYSPLRELGDLKIYIDVPREIRVARRMIRDVQKGRNDIDTLSWSIVVEKNHQKYIEPMKQYADLVIPFSYNPVEFTE
jgi:uridine kinase